jgi:hypothetical protein
MPDDTIRPSLEAATWVNHWVDQNLPPDPTDGVAWRYAVGCTTTLAMPRLAPLLEYIGMAVSEHKLSPLDMLLIGNMITDVSQQKWNRSIAPEMRQYLNQRYSATKDVAEEYVEQFSVNGLPTAAPD